MNIDNLVFFDKNGESYNFGRASSGNWEGADYFLPISLELYDCSNIFILENTNGVYTFPKMESGSRFEVKWKTANNNTNLFLFNVLVEGTGTDAYNYLEKQEYITINHSDFNQAGTLSLTYPLQLNIAFTPSDEIAYARVLQIYYKTATDSTLVLELTVYGEGEGEDERLRIWLANFGIKFNRQDALLLKDYDLKEALADYKELNAIRKLILVNRDQIYPYIGTYKGLLNILSLMGYRDVLRVKEYWRDIDPNSPYRNKFAMVDFTDLLDSTEDTTFDLVDQNNQIKTGGKFEKTEFLALAYQFSKAGDTYDDDGLPNVITTTDFTVNEIFFKLHGVVVKLKDEIIPINVVIKDIIGEFIYFEKFNIRYWIDETTIESFSLSDEYRINIVEPADYVSSFNHTFDTPVISKKIKLSSPLNSAISVGHYIRPDVGSSYAQLKFQFVGKSKIDGLPILKVLNTTTNTDLILDNFQYQMTISGAVSELDNVPHDGINFALNDIDNTRTDTGLDATGSFNQPWLGFGGANGMTASLIFESEQNIVDTIQNTNSNYLKIRDLKPLYRKAGGISIFPETSFNLGLIDPYDDGQFYSIDKKDTLIQTISDYYSTLKSFIFEYPNSASPLDQGDDTSDKIGCPIVLEAYVPDLTLQQLDGIQFIDFITVAATTSSSTNTIGTGLKYFSCATIQPFVVGDYIKVYQSAYYNNYMIGRITEINPPSMSGNTIVIDVYSYNGEGTLTGWTVQLIDRHFTINNLKYKNVYEIEWIITGPQNYRFEWRTSTLGTNKIPHILPHTGEYAIEIRAYDMSGAVSNQFRKITVSPDQPVIQVFTKIPDKFRYDFKNLDNVTIGDLADSPLYYPYLNVINSEISSISNHYLDWNTYSNYYGVGNYILGSRFANHNDIKLSITENSLIPYSQSTETIKNSWGTGSANGQATISNYLTASLGDLYYVNFSNFGLTADQLDGFYITLRGEDYQYNLNSNLVAIQFGGFDEINLTTLSNPTIEEVLDYLQNTSEPGLSNYSYQVIETQVGPSALPISRIKATATYQDPQNHSIIKLISIVTGLDSSLNKWTPSSANLTISSTDPLIYGPSSLPQTVYGPSSVPVPAITDGEYTLTDFGGSETLYGNTYLAVGDRLRIQNDNGDYIEGTITQMTVGETVIIIDQAHGAGILSDFNLFLIDTVYTFNKPVSVFNQTELDKIQQNLLQTNLRIDEDLLFLDCPFDDCLQTLNPYTPAAASNINYWIDKGFVKYDNSEIGPSSIPASQTGYLPSNYDENSFNLSNIKLTYGSLIVPLHHPIFITIANLVSNIETVWTLKLNDELIVKVISTSYFIWRFTKPGTYTLDIDSVDTRGNHSISTSSIIISTLVTPNEYKNYIEKQLNIRKYKIEHS